MANSTNSPAPPAVNPAPRIVLLTAGGDLGRIVANGLAQRLGSIVVIEETPETKAQIIRRRIRMRGVVETAGQIAFGLFQRLFERQARARLEKIWNAHDLDPTLDPAIEVHRVPSINSEECRALLRQAMPAAVAVYGTRIIGRATLGCLTVPFINYHAGINPKYRGQHPAYWARARGDDANCGITITWSTRAWIPARCSIRRRSRSRRRIPSRLTSTFRPRRRCRCLPAHWRTPSPVACDRAA